MSAGEKGERASAFAVAAARKWVDWYSGLVEPVAGERRRAEIESDLWEQKADARGTGRPDVGVAIAIVLRVAGGMADDALWVRAQRLALRSREADRKGSAVDARSNSLASWWWVAGAGVLAAFYLGFAADNLTSDHPYAAEGAAQCFSYLAIMLAGIAARVKTPRLSAVLIAAAALPTLTVFWAPPLMIFGAAVVTGALIEVGFRSAPHAVARTGAVVGAVLIGVGTIVPMLGIGPTSGLSLGGSVMLGAVAIASGTALLLFTRTPASRTPAPGAPAIQG